MENNELKEEIKEQEEIMSAKTTLDENTSSAPEEVELSKAEDNKEFVEDKQEKTKKVCVYCGADLLDEQDFCHKCGKRIRKPNECIKCGAVLAEGQEFCSKCGTPRFKRITCLKCGTELKEGEGFCPRCGQRAGSPIYNSISTAINQVKDTASNVKSEKKKIPTKAIIIAIAAIALIIGAINFVPKLFIDTAGYIEKGNLEKAWKKAKTDDEKQMVFDAYMEKGDLDKACEIAITDDNRQKVLDAYIEKGDIDKACVIADTDESRQKVLNAYFEAGKIDKAYEIAQTDEEKQMAIEAYCGIGDYKTAFEKALNENSKNQVRIENIAAILSKKTSESLKDPSSFELKEFFFQKDIYRAAMSVVGANSYGAKVTNFWLYTIAADKKDWELYDSFTDLEDEEYKSYDDADDKLEKLLRNFGREMIRDCARSGIELSKEGIKRINNLFKDGKLENIKGLDEPNFSTDNKSA